MGGVAFFSFGAGIIFGDLINDTRKLLDARMDARDALADDAQRRLGDKDDRFLDYYDPWVRSRAHNPPYSAATVRMAHFAGVVIDGVTVGSLHQSCKPGECPYEGDKKCS
jgi:hypothetical protein